ncbi:hypothetical protein [Pseudomonas fluorescens]|uniref:hypothetical protein n=1 Tax=Pseudomonas fluorescens TaxID=294 RepID=UPI0013985EE3|nr:hypothetical protein [Pseudomonas fluorescens]QIA03427.1 hypothetical protein GZH78_15130 [Pseudomonas fluorescens]
MKYFKINPNVSSKKWAGYLNPHTKLFEGTKPISSISLSDSDQKITKALSYKPLTDGPIPPINTIGSQFIAFDSNIKGITSIDGDGTQLVSINNSTIQHTYLLMHVYNHIDCVNWNLSEFDPWPENYAPEEWESKRARFFITPVIYLDKIPKELNSFRLKDWSDAFNIVVTEKLKNKILSLDFDHSFLEFHELKLT